MDRFMVLGGNIDEVVPKVDDASESYVLDGQYIFMNRWALEKIVEQKSDFLVDIGSQVSFLWLLAYFIPVVHVDIRDPGIKGAGFQFRKGDITNLPFGNETLEAVSCLHVAEHIGLGRYGDKIDPDGFRKACGELGRVIKPGGRLYFSVPIGIPRVCFNAHRVIGPMAVVDAFPGFSLTEFSAIDSIGIVHYKSRPETMAKETYACGFYELTKN